MTKNELVERYTSDTTMQNINFDKAIENAMVNINPNGRTVVLRAYYKKSKPIIAEKGEWAGQEIVRVVWRTLVVIQGRSVYSTYTENPLEGWQPISRVMKWKEQWDSIGFPASVACKSYHDDPAGFPKMIDLAFHEWTETRGGIEI